jgi:hypothetical protein
MHQAVQVGLLHERPLDGYSLTDRIVTLNAT